MAAGKSTHLSSKDTTVVTHDLGIQPSNDDVIFPLDEIRQATGDDIAAARRNIMALEQKMDCKLANRRTAPDNVLHLASRTIQQTHRTADDGAPVPSQIAIFSTGKEVLVTIKSVNLLGKTRHYQHNRARKNKKKNFNQPAHQALHCRYHFRE
jgi:hypothetical protein